VVTDAFEPDETTERFQALYSPVLAAFLLLITSPVLLFVALWVRLSSKGPVFGKTLRAGQNGKAFLLRGFRTEGVPGAQFLRRTGVYRWPALLNVLAGDLAFVGPAPERPEFVERLCALLPFYRQRCRVKPGLTGWEQVHRSQWRERDTLRQLEYDLYYIKNLGPSLDSAVLLLALKAKLL
jgi:lipopolysaccharide/colanic/teichoic acid biosynthesis glycosyltransferase